MVPLYSVLKTKINALQYDQILDQMASWIDQKEHGRYIIAANVHVVMQAYKDTQFKWATDQADLIVPDGMPLVYIGRWRGLPIKNRAYGPTIMQKALANSSQNGWSHFFYGGTPQVLDSLAQILNLNYPGIRIAGSYAPPFRPLSEEEDQLIIEKVNYYRLKAGSLVCG